MTPARPLGTWFDAAVPSWLGHTGVVRIRQYATFSLSSEVMSAASITAELRIEPDRFSVRGARRAAPPVPVRHSWTLVCAEPGLQIDQLTEKVLQRVRPVADAIRGLVRSGDVDAGIVIVRDFDDDEGEEENLDPVVLDDGSVLHALAGQHQLLGWQFDPETLAFLTSIGASLAADEYGG